MNNYSFIFIIDIFHSLRSMQHSRITQSHFLMTRFMSSEEKFDMVQTRMWWGTRAGLNRTDIFFARPSTSVTCKVHLNSNTLKAASKEREKEKYDCTIDQELAGAAAQAPADVSCLLTRQHHFFAFIDAMAAILKVWRQIQNLSIDVHLLQEQSCQISSRPDFAPDRPCWASTSAWALSYSAVKLFSKNSNVCGHGTWSSQTDRRTDGRHAIS